MQAAACREGEAPAYQGECDKSSVSYAALLDSRHSVLSVGGRKGQAKGLRGTVRATGNGHRGDSQ